MASAPGWYEDPAHRHERRFWDGTRWTDQVADGSLVLMDPLQAAPPAVPSPMPWPVAATGSMPGAPPGTVTIPPLPFAPYARVAGGLVATSYVAVDDAGTLTVTGRIVPAHHQRAYRIVSPIAGVVMLIVMLAGLGSLIASTGSTTDASGTTQQNGGAGAMAMVLLVVGLSIAFGMMVWERIARRAAAPGVLAVPAHQVTRVRTGYNAHNLWWFLLIGIWALIPYFAGRKVLRVSVPTGAPGDPPVRLMMRETHKGDAELISARLRMGGAR